MHSVFYVTKIVKHEKRLKQIFKNHKLML